MRRCRKSTWSSLWYSSHMWAPSYHLPPPSFLPSPASCHGPASPLTSCLRSPPGSCLFCILLSDWSSRTQGCLYISPLDSLHLLASGFRALTQVHEIHHVTPRLPVGAPHLHSSFCCRDSAHSLPDLHTCPSWRWEHSLRVVARPGQPCLPFLLALVPSFR